MTINRQRLWMADRLEELHRDRTRARRSRRRARIAAAELVENETPVFPHYSLLEGHDRFDRLPNRRTRNSSRCTGRAAISRRRSRCSTSSAYATGSRTSCRPIAAEEPKRYCVEKESRDAADVLAHGDRPPRCRQARGLRPRGRRPEHVRRGRRRSVTTASATPARCHRRSRTRSRRATWSPARCSPATATSRAASTLKCGRTTSRRRRSSSRTRSPGNIDIDLYNEPLGLGKDGKPVYLKDIWPTHEEIHDAHREARDVEDVQVELRERVQGRQQLAGHRVADGRDLHLVRRFHLRKEPALLRRHDAATRHAG